MSRRSAARARGWTSRCRISTPAASSAARCARRPGACVRLLLQGKVDYRIAAIAARVLYDEMHANGIRIYEYTPAFLHAKVAVVDEEWATVGSSNIDPLSLLLNLEANVVVRDAEFARSLAARFEAAFAASTEISAAPARAGWRRWLRRAGVAWAANLYLRVAGITGAVLAGAGSSPRAHRHHGRSAWRAARANVLRPTLADDAHVVLTGRRRLHHRGK
ncbi:MAG: phospholipase D-like domain-containing protein [Rubrivivax sp.]